MITYTLLLTPRGKLGFISRLTPYALHLTVVNISGTRNP